MIGKIVRLILRIYNRIAEYIEYKYYILFSKNNLYKKKVQGSWMLLRTDDPGISKELLLTGVHEERTTAIVKKELKEGMNIIEVGANVGYYSLLESRLIGKAGTVYAIEPVPENFERLNENIIINNRDNIISYNFAISDHPGSADFFLTNESNWGSMVDPASDFISTSMTEKLQERHNEKITVQTKTVDEFVKNQGITEVNLIRMDIEGYEIQALNGMKELLDSSTNLRLLIEVHNKIFTNPKESLGPTFDMLLKYGFMPKILIAKEDEHYDIEPNQFIDIITSYKDICCHLLMEKVK
jgi:FkbM family methyltransferase